MPTQLERQECAGDLPISDRPPTGAVDPFRSSGLARSGHLRRMNWARALSRALSLALGHCLTRRRFDQLNGTPLKIGAAGS
ncbi:MAG: hypothetical protein ABI939_10110 [Anaerolineaceae bacterium]